MPAPRNELTDKQKAFIAEYIKTKNATHSAIVAGYSQKNAGKIGPELLGKTRIQNEINKYFNELRQEVKVEVQEIVQEFKNIGFSDLLPMYNDDGTLKHPKDWPEHLRRAVSSIETEEIFEYVDGEKIWTGYVKKVKFWSKNNALENLGRHKKMFKDIVELDVSDKLADHLAKARQRTNE